MYNHYTDTVSNYLHAYETKDRKALENVLAEDFTFTSPYDDHIDRARYFEKCWPTNKNVNRIEIKNLVEDNGKVFALYQLNSKDRGIFQNTEFITFENDKIKSIEVYFGATDSSSIKSVSGHTT